MKKYIFLLLIVAICSCQKSGENTPPTPPPPLKYNVTIIKKGDGTVNPESSLTITDGTSAVVTATPNAGNVLYSAVLSGVGPMTLDKREGEIQLNISNIKSHTTLNIDFINKHLYTLIKSSKPYHLDSMNVYNEAGKMIAVLGMTDFEKSAENTFLYPEMNFKTVAKNGTTSLIPFSVSGNSITIGAYTNTITKNDDKHFSMRTPLREVPGWPFVIATEYVYSRQYP